MPCSTDPPTSDSTVCWASRQMAAIQSGRLSWRRVFLFLCVFVECPNIKSKLLLFFRKKSTFINTFSESSVSTQAILSQRLNEAPFRVYFYTAVQHSNCQSRGLAGSVGWLCVFRPYSYFRVLIYCTAPLGTQSYFSNCFSTQRLKQTWTKFVSRWNKNETSKNKLQKSLAYHPHRCPFQQYPTIIPGLLCYKNHFTDATFYILAPASLPS